LDLGGVVTRSGSPTALGRNRQSDIIDEQHLARMTLGDSRLEREVLELFLRQAALMLGRIGAAPPALAAAAAHTLKGSARGIGAWRLAQAAEAFEHAVQIADEIQIKDTHSELTASSREACAAIAARPDRSFTSLAQDH
jgi:HPt (histidine-containing phosphotransfer) domain-containing protein